MLITGPQICKNKRVTISSFRGKPYVHIREYYEDKDTGEMKPTKKGIALTAEQWEDFLELVDDVSGALGEMQ